VNLHRILQSPSKIFVDNSSTQENCPANSSRPSRYARVVEARDQTRRFAPVKQILTQDKLWIHPRCRCVPMLRVDQVNAASSQETHLGHHNLITSQSVLCDDIITSDVKRSSNTSPIPSSTKVVVAPSGRAGVEYRIHCRSMVFKKGVSFASIAANSFCGITRAPRVSVTTVARGFWDLQPRSCTPSQRQVIPVLDILSVAA